MINFWGIQKSFLIIRTVSSGWKYNFSGRRGAVNGQQLVVMDAVRQSTCIPVHRAWLPLCGTQAVLGNDELQPRLVSRPLERQHVDVTLHTHPRAVGGYQGDNLAEPSCLWWYLSFTASSGSSRKLQLLLRQRVLCVSPCAGAVRGQKHSPTRALTDSCTRFVYEELWVEINMQIRSALST